MRSLKSVFTSAKRRLKRSARRVEDPLRLATGQKTNPVVGPTQQNQPDEPDQEGHLSRSSSGPQDVRKSITHVPVVDEEVSVNITLNYDDELLEKIFDFRVRWTNPLLLDVLEEKVASCLKECRLVLEATKLHRESGRCRLIRQSDQKIIETTTWENEAQWREALPLMIIQFYMTQVKEPFFLDIKWEYVDPYVLEVQNEPYDITVIKAITKKMTKNFNNIDYISKPNLVTILSKMTISLLVDRDTSLTQQVSTAVDQSGNRHYFDRDAFIREVFLDGVRLLALHVYTHTPLLCLFKMMRRGALDVHLFEKPLSDKDCPCDDYSHNFKLIVQTQKQFLPHTFAQMDKLPGQDRLPSKIVMPAHHNLHSEIVLPIQSHGKIGSGGCGEVFKVSVDTGHHSFACDNLDNFFAMKVFFHSGQRTAEDFKRESNMLKTLAEFPHPHLTPYLASWTQLGRFYMLFPLAKSNLRTFWQTTPAQELDASFMLWLVSQLAGLADGVRKIHNIGPRAGTSLRSELHKPVSGKARIGFHHDLRPENILLFEAKDATQPTLRISDFGSANFTQMPSGVGIDSRPSYKTPGRFHGDPIYGAPEIDGKEGISRPYDIWSLGCIFLEILLWVFRFDLQTFDNQRLLTSRRTMKSESLVFWYRNSAESEPKLKPAVNDRLQQLVDRCKGFGIFEDLVSVIRKMLSILPAKRSTAALVHDALDAMKMQLHVELADNPRAYTRKGKHPIYAAPHSNAIDGLSSIGNRESISPSFEHLAPNGFTHRRTNSDGKQAMRSIERSSFSDIQQLPRVDTDLPLFNGRSRSPSIAISHVDDPDLVTDGMDELDHLDQPLLVGAHSYTGSWYAVSNNRSPSVRSRRSFSDGDVPSRPFTLE